MAETTNAASSPAEVEDVFQGQNVSMAEFSHYRQSGELPERFKPVEAETAPADSPEETVESAVDETETAPESEPEEIDQEPPQKPSAAEKRIKQLLARVKELEGQSAAKPDVKPESSPAQPQYTRPKPTLDDKNEKGEAKYASYEEFIEDVADWKAEQKLADFQRRQAEQAALQSLKKQLDDARQRYEDADAVIAPTAKKVNEANIPPVVKQVFGDSDVFIDLCYVMGSDPEELQKFVSLAQTNPRAALAQVFEYERQIRAELNQAEKPAAEPAKSGEKAPEKKQTSAPKPPTPVSGGGSRSFDVNDESLSADEWARKRNAQLNKRGKG